MTRNRHYVVGFLEILEPPQHVFIGDERKVGLRIAEIDEDGASATCPTFYQRVRTIVHEQA